MGRASARGGGRDNSTTTITDVARLADVSPTTVSRVLNGGYPVSTDTRARVERAVRELSYVRNAHAQALRIASTGLIGVIIHDVADPYFAEIVAGIQEVAATGKRLVVLCNSLRDPGSELRYVEMLRGQRADAVILAGGAIGDAAYLQELPRQARWLTRQGARMIMCGRHGLEADAVVPDNRGGAHLLANHLLRRGHRRIAEIAGPPNFSTTEERSAGLAEALAEAGIARDPALVVSGHFSRDGGYEATRQLLRGEARFTAIFAANDMMALGALAALREAGLRVPQDMSLVGFDDLPILRDVVPGLTTIRVPMREMGRRCMTLAMAAARRSPRLETLPVELVERESVDAPSGQ
jgi:LacI family transcriptional regulator, galactose operon repressor